MAKDTAGDQPMTTTDTAPLSELLDASDFYRTASGNVGISLDGGETLFNHAGRKMAVSGAWSEIDSEEASEITEDCLRAALTQYIANERARTSAAAFEAGRKAEAERRRQDRQAREREYYNGGGFDRDMARMIRSIIRLLG